jgi:hypothetical protein
VRNAYRSLVKKPGGKKACERPRHRYEGNIETDVREVGCGSVDWLDLALDRVE